MSTVASLLFQKKTKLGRDDGAFVTYLEVNYAVEHLFVQIPHGNVENIPQ